jgi:hypothetical protein
VTPCCPHWPRRRRTRAFGVERAGDNLGAVVGPLVAAWLVTAIGIRPAIWCAATPGVPGRGGHHRCGSGSAPTTPSPRRAISFHMGALRRAGLVRPVIPVVFFECGNAAVTLLILRATELLQTDRSLSRGGDVLGGTHLRRPQCSGDSRGLRRWTLDRSLESQDRLHRGGPALHRCLCRLRNWADTWPHLLIAFVLAGIGIGLSETSESTLLASAVSDRLRGSAFSVFGGVQAVGDIVSSLTVGMLYVTVSPEVAFAYVAGWMALSLGSSVLFVTARRPFVPMDSRDSP